MPSSDRRYQERKDVPLPPISHIFDARSQEGTSLSLPPLRTDGDRSSQAYGRMPGSIPALQHPVAPTSSDSRRPRHDHSRMMSLHNPSYTPAPYSTDHIAPSAGFTTYQHSGYPSPNHYPPPHHQTSQRMIPSSTRIPGATTPNPAGHYYTHATAGHEMSMSSSASHQRTQYSESSRPHAGAGPSYQHSQTRRASTSEEEDAGAPKAKYECSYCGKGFLRPSALKIHLISHTGDKGKYSVLTYFRVKRLPVVPALDYVCPEESCGRRFGVRSNMLRHIRLVHQNLHQSSGEELSSDDWIS